MISPVWKQPHLFLAREDLDTERRQCEDEGKNLALPFSPSASPSPSALSSSGPPPSSAPLHSVAREFDRLAALDLDDPANWPAGWALLDRTAQLPIRPDFPFHEPTALADIQAARPQGRPKLPPLALSDAGLLDKILGAWTGRCCGCLLGKPIEGWPHPKIEAYLRDAGNWPLSRYMTRDLPEAIRQLHDLKPNFAWIDEVECMPEDDDINYTVLGMLVLQRHGADFTPADMAALWFQNLPIGHTWSAERAALRNLAMMIGPPESATFRNPYREWIGAQIRADAFGYAAPGQPERAAAWAWRDASISHVKNGVYGEMWAAAMIAAAAVLDDPASVLEAGLAEIPRNCRLARTLREIIGWRAEAIDFEQAMRRVQQRWNDRKSHDLIHVESNAAIVAIGLLWGEGDFAASIARTVQCGFDTDCNGATVGSILGMIHGAKKLPDSWTAPLRGEVITGVAGRHKVSIASLAQETLELARSLQQS